MFKKSKAIFYLLKQTKLKYAIYLLELVIPLKFSDYIYDLIAKHRNKICKPKKRWIINYMKTLNKNHHFSVNSLYPFQ